MCRAQRLVVCSYPAIGQWEGDGLSVDVGVEDAGEILLEYAKACMKKVISYVSNMYVRESQNENK